MTLTAPIPLPAPPHHPPIRVQARIPDTVNGLTWTYVLTTTRAMLEVAIIRNLQPSAWSILDGETTCSLRAAAGGTWILEAVWVQR